MKPNSTVADVACHHAHVAVQLVLNKIASRVIGTELTEGSWRVACDTVHKYQVQQYVDIRLGDGKDTFLVLINLNNTTTTLITNVCF